MYELDGDLLMVASDRISAYDVIMPNPIPDKGRVLTQMSLFWFESTSAICPNHFLSEDVPPEVAGRASVFVFPDLDTGNTTYKAVQRSAQVVSIGPMLQGLAKPVNDLSRGALVEDIIYTIALTAIQARAT